MISSFGFLILRLCVGILLIHHGYEKLNDIENFANAFVRPLHLPFPVTLSYIAALSEIVGSWMLITGLGIRIGALAIFGTMTIAIYHAIMTSGFNIYLLELLGLYWGGALCLVFNGGGKFSIDHLIYRNNKDLYNNILQVVTP
jgi:putative oxidoreductase